MKESVELYKFEENKAILGVHYWKEIPQKLVDFLGRFQFP